MNSSQMSINLVKTRILPAGQAWGGEALKKEANLIKKKKKKSRNQRKTKVQKLAVPGNFEADGMELD